MAGEHGMGAAELDVSGMDLGSLIDVAEIQPVLDSFTKLTGMVTAVLDVKGEVVVATGWRDICMNFHRKNPVSAALCAESDRLLSSDLKKGEYVDYRCKNGLWDVVTPLFLGGRHVGNVFSGQYFYDTDVVDEAFFVDQAERYGFDRESYLRALRLVPRYDRRTIETLMEYLVGYFTQVSKKSCAAMELAKQYVEKELILREVHHRIKNNMSTMSGLLTLRAAGLTDPSAVAAFDDAKRCMQSMAFLYDRLYKSGGGSDLQVGRYLDSLVDEILGNFPGIELIRVEKRLDDFMLDAVRLQPLGIILNELLTNAMKYAFPAGTGGTITVSALLRDGRASVSVRDDGGGIPEGVDAGRSSGFGLTLVGALAEQLGGTVGIARDGGTAVTVEFDL